MSEKNPSLDELLIMAVACEGLPIEIVNETDPGVTANGGGIGVLVLQWLGQRTKNNYRALQMANDEDAPIVEEMHTRLMELAMAADNELLVRGFGGFGQDGEPPTALAFQSYGLTSRGWDLAHELFKKFPQYRESIYRE